MLSRNDVPVNRMQDCGGIKVGGSFLRKGFDRFFRVSSLEL